jgi:hypothetical protein
LQIALKTIIAVAHDPTAYYCDRLKKALDGQLIGTHDASLTRIIVSRAEIDLATIEAIYASTYVHPPLVANSALRACTAIS